MIKISIRGLGFIMPGLRDWPAAGRVLAGLDHCSQELWPWKVTRLAPKLKLFRKVMRNASTLA